jgi:hypothetical protein
MTALNFIGVHQASAMVAGLRGKRHLFSLRITLQEKNSRRPQTG